jgi:hypothetical protein
MQMTKLCFALCGGERIDGPTAVTGKSSQSEELLNMSEMKKDLMSTTSGAPSTQESDGLGTFDLTQFGMKGGAFGGAKILKYVTDHYVTTQGEAIGPEREFAVLGLKKIVQKFVGHKLVDSEIVPDGAPMPDIEAMNQAAPREEWGTGLDGKPQGPYVRIIALQLLDPNTMDRFAFITQTVGGAIAVGDLTDKIKIMRRFNGADTVPVVTLGTTPFRIARLNVTKKRPDFRVARWIKLCPDGSKPSAPASIAGPSTAQPMAPPTPPASAPVSTPMSTPAQPPFTPAPATVSAPTAFGTPVQEPTMAQEMEDTVPF